VKNGGIGGGFGRANGGARTKKFGVKTADATQTRVETRTVEETAK